jgi:hypothetical protein
MSAGDFPSPCPDSEETGSASPFAEDGPDACVSIDVSAREEIHPIAQRSSSTAVRLRRRIEQNPFFDVIHAISKPRKGQGSHVFVTLVDHGNHKTSSG